MARLRVCCGRARRAALPCLALLPLLAGCGLLRPDPLAADVALPARFGATAGAPEPARWPEPEWWRGFGAPELDALMAAAMAANFDLAAAAARVREADALVRVAGGALLPAVDLSAAATRSQAAASGSFARRRVGSADSLGLAASYEVDFWGRNRAALDAAGHAAAARRHDLGTVALTAQAAVANTYFALLAAQEQVAIQQANLAAAARVLDILRERLAVGTATGLQVAQQETVVAQQRALLPGFRLQVEQNRHALALLTGRAPEAIAIEGGVFNRLRVPEVAPGLPAELLLRRPDVLAAEAELAAQQANVVVARAALFPSIRLTASGGFQSLALETLLRPESQLFSLAAGLTEPIFRGGALRAQVTAERARQEELLALYRRAIVNALVDTENALAALRRTAEQERLQAEAVATAERANAIAEEQLRAGTIDLVALLLAQQSLFTARTLLVQARLARLQAAVGLFRALGGGWGTAGTIPR
ncbi:efflux transporter outer membrane subunit [Caldovatus sp. SYSU G05006]|uniref:Efflux transporter outer membrane subunit n=2 Tax=Caldovatus aquaticus TaxID=2865671 RepID=A0ABS7F585_9PROT|nr:efflux transporter outer membrane subunit [Caldovatus aquaticus]